MNQALAAAFPAQQAPARPRLMAGPPATRADYVLLQITQALGGNLLRLSTSREIDMRQLAHVAGMLADLAPHSLNRRHNLALAEQAAGTLDSIGHAHFSPGTSFALAQARSDAAYLVRTAQDGAPPLAPPYPNQALPVIGAFVTHVLRCLNPAQGGSANPYDAALLNILANLQCIASNAGGMEMPEPIRAALSAVVSAVATVVQRRGPGLQAAQAISQPLMAFVYALSTFTGGAYGTKNGLLSLNVDLTTLAYVPREHAPFATNTRR